MRLKKGEQLARGHTVKSVHVIPALSFLASDLETRLPSFGWSPGSWGDTAGTQEPTEPQVLNKHNASCLHASLLLKVFLELEQVLVIVLAVVGFS